MKVNSKWIKNYKSVVDNDRKHGLVADLPPEEDGDDFGPTALELAVMGLGGCISTIYAKVAKKMRLELNSLDVELEAEKPEGADTVTAVTGQVLVDSTANQDRLEKCLEQTFKTCPVGRLFEKAGVTMDIELVSK